MSASHVIKTMDDAVQLLASYIPAPQQMHKNYSLDRMVELMELFDNPQNDFKSVHVAGTSGKTSTAYFLRELLERAGISTGMTVSPHITSITERIQLNGHAISDDKFLYYLNSFYQKLISSTIKPTYYELLVALAYVVFREEKVEYAIVETGLGGLLDATNVINRNDKVCVITDIGLDHTDVLGTTYEEIARQKAGIVQSGNTVIIQSQPQHIQDVLIQCARDRGASKTIVSSLKSTNIPVGLPEFQQRNWAIALQVYNEIAQCDQLPDVSSLQVSEIVRAQPPGRMETFFYKDKMIIMDGAHNGQKMEAFVRAIQSKYANKVSVLVSFASNESHRIEDGLRALLPITQKLVITEFSLQRDMGKTASSSEAMKRYAEQVGYENVEVIKNPQDALDYIVLQPNDEVIITGSLYLVALLRPYIKGV